MKEKQNEIYEINLNVANDSGNSNQKTIINGEYFIQPNVIRKITKKPELSTKSLEGVIKNLDNEQSQIEMLLAVKEAFAKYTPEAFERIPKVIMLRAKEYQNGSDIGGVTFIVDEEPKLMTLYYEVGKYQGWNYLDWYRVTINHEIFHCLDEFVYKTDFIWENLEEDCHNVSDYACVAGREEKAETWARYLINNVDKNPIKLDYLMAIYGDYLKENPCKRV